MTREEIFEKIKRLGNEFTRSPYFFAALCGTDPDDTYEGWPHIEEDDWYEEEKRELLSIVTEDEYEEIKKYCSQNMVWEYCSPEEVGYVLCNTEEYDEDGNENDWYWLYEQYGSNPEVCLSSDGDYTLFTGHTRGCDDRLVELIIGIISVSPGVPNDMLCTSRDMLNC